MCTLNNLQNWLYLRNELLFLMLHYQVNAHSFAHIVGVADHLLLLIFARFIIEHILEKNHINAKLRVVEGSLLVQLITKTILEYIQVRFVFRDRHQISLLKLSKLKEIH